MKEKQETKWYSIQKVAKMLCVTKSAIFNQYRKKRYPNAIKCECGIGILINEEDIKKSILPMRPKVIESIKKKLEDQKLDLKKKPEDYDILPT